MPTIKLSYFDFGVRADGVRIALHMAGIDFEDERISFAQFGEMKKNNTLPLGQLPVLEIDGVKYTQYNAMVRYAGTLAGIYPENALDRLKVEEIIELCSEFLYKIPSHTDEEEKKRLRQEFASQKATALLSLVNKRIETNGTGWAVGDSLTVADLTVMCICDFLESGFIDHIDTALHKSFPAIAAFHKKVKEHEPVAKYYASLKSQ